MGILIITSLPTGLRIKIFTILRDKTCTGWNVNTTRWPNTFHWTTKTNIWKPLTLSVFFSQLSDIFTYVCVRNKVFEKKNCSFLKNIIEPCSFFSISWLTKCNLSKYWKRKLQCFFHQIKRKNMTQTKVRVDNVNHKYPGMRTKIEKNLYVWCLGLQLRWNRILKKKY